MLFFAFYVRFFSECEGRILTTTRVTNGIGKHAVLRPSNYLLESARQLGCYDSCETDRAISLLICVCEVNDGISDHRRSMGPRKLPTIDEQLRMQVQSLGSQVEKFKEVCENKGYQRSM